LDNGGSMGGVNGFKPDAGVRSLGVLTGASGGVIGLG
jgi:hypothetical protein